MITAELVKDLREKTGAGMMDCKKVLTEANGDMEKAIELLRERGIAKAAKKSDRVAAEGLCSVVVEGNNAVVFEVNSETDFVAQNEKFTSLLAKVGEIIIASDAQCTDCALEVVTDGKTLKEFLNSITEEQIAAYFKAKEEAANVEKKEGVE